MKLYFGLLLSIGILCQSIRCQMNDSTEDADLGLDPFNNSSAQTQVMPH